MQASPANAMPQPTPPNTTPLRSVCPVAFRRAMHKADVPINTQALATPANSRHDIQPSQWLSRPIAAVISTTSHRPSRNRVAGDRLRCVTSSAPSR